MTTWALRPVRRGWRHRLVLVVLAAVVGYLASAAGGAQTRDWPSERPPRPLAARDLKFPPYEIRTLPNGLQVVTVLHHEQPVVSMRLLVRAGSAAEPKDKLGLARLLASLLDQGTTRQSAQALNDDIDFIGGDKATGAASDLSFVSTLVMKDSFEHGVQLLSDMARRPAFSQEEIDRQREQVISSLQVSADSPDWVASAVFERLVYGAHPYGLPDSGTPETLARITRDDLVAFHRTFFAPNNAVLAVVGDVSADEAFATVSKIFGDWERHDVPVRPLAPPPAPARRVIIVNKPDSVQTEVRMGHIGIPRRHNDYMALGLAVRILGGEGSNRLHQVLRTERSLTYGAQAVMDALKDSGDIVATTNTRSEATGQVLGLIVDEFRRIQRELVDGRELADAKAYITGSFPLSIETPGAIATQVLHAVFYGLPLSELETYRERVNAVTADQIQRAAQFYLKPDQLSVVLVGNAAAFTSQLRAAGFGEYEVIEIGDLDLMSPDFKRPAGARRRAAAGAPLPAARPRAAYTARSGQPQVGAPRVNGEARALLDKVVAAKGGFERLRAVRGIRAVTQLSIPLPQGTVTAETTTYLEYPDHVHVEAKTPQGTQIQIFDGQRGWVRDPSGIYDVPEDAIRDMRVGLRRDAVPALLAASRGEFGVRLLPDVQDPTGVTFRALEVAIADVGPVVLLVDPQTNLIARQVYSGAPGLPAVEESFSDYRRVDGVMISFAAEVRQGGELRMQRRVVDFAVNPVIDPQLFKRPA